MDKRILVTGSEGFIGKHLMKAIPEADRLDIVDHNDVRNTLPNIDYTHGS